jgi:hypothetical protein
LTAQLPTYLEAEQATGGILIFIKVAGNALRLRRIQETHAALVRDGRRVPDLVIVDATARPSASRVRGSP